MCQPGDDLREFGAGEVVAPLVVREEALGAVRLPAHRPLRCAGRGVHPVTGKRYVSMECIAGGGGGRAGANSLR